MKAHNDTYTDEQIEWLKKNYADCTRAEAVSVLNKPWNTVKSRAYRLGLTRAIRGKGPVWPDSQESALKEHIDSGLSRSRIAAIMGRSEKSIENKVYSMGWRFRNPSPKQRRTKTDGQRRAEDWGMSEKTCSLVTRFNQMSLRAGND